MRQALYTFLCFVLMLASGSAVAASSEDRPGSPAWKLDLGGDPVRIRKAIDDLLDPDPAIWHEAQIRLAAAGEPAIRELDGSALIRDSTRADRIKPIVSLALYLHLSPEALDQYPRVRRLVDTEIQRGILLADSLRGLKCVVIEDLQLGWTIADLGGFKAYAGRALLADSVAVARGFAGRILRDIEPAREAMRGLLHDQASVEICASDHSRSATVAENVRIQPVAARFIWFESVVYRMSIADGTEHLRSYQFRQGQPEPPWLTDLLGGIRQTSRSMQAQSWDEWWNEARPIWRRWWDLARDRSYPPDREKWLSRLEAEKNLQR